MKLFGIRSEYIQKHTLEDNGNIETFQDAQKLLEYAFNDYNTVMPHSSFDYFSLDEFERRWTESANFWNEFLEERNRKGERTLKNRIERKRRLKENVSLDDRISVQN